MTTQQIIRILIFALIFVVPVVIRLVKAAQDAKEKRRLEQLRQYQINEAMRTGRPIEPVMMAQNPAASSGGPAPYNPQQSAQDRLREMAARRQAQIEALRRQKSGGSSTPATMASPATGYRQTVGESAPTAFQQKPGVATGYQQQAPVATGYQPQQARPQTGQQARQQPRPQQRQPKRAQPQRDPRRQPVAGQATASAPPPQDFPPPTGEIAGSYHEHDGDVTHRLVADGPSMTPVARPSSGERGAVKVKLSDLRQAIVLREVLGKPMALREADGV